MSRQREKAGKQQNNEVEVTPAEANNVEDMQQNETAEKAREKQQPARAGRPTLCTPEVIEAVAHNIRQYGFIVLSYTLAGVSDGSHHNWMQRGEEDIAAGREDTPFAAYVRAVKKARAEFQAEATRAIREGKQGWQSRAWMLERSDPEQYALRQRVEHSGRIETNAAPVLSPAEYEARRAAILGGRGANAARVQH